VADVEPCPKCGRPIENKVFFQQMDHKGIIGMVEHDITQKEGAFGSYRSVGTRCFLNLEEACKIFNIRHVQDNIYWRIPS